MPTRLVAPSASSAANASDEGSSSFRSETTYGSREARSGRKGWLAGGGRSYPTRDEPASPWRQSMKTVHEVASSFRNQISTEFAVNRVPRSDVAARSTSSRLSESLEASAMDARMSLRLASDRKSTR